MTMLGWFALAVVAVTIYALIKRIETRLVLLCSGLFLCLVSGHPMAGLDAFAKSMTNATLVQVICGSMGFAFVASYTKADRALVHYMSKPIHGLGIFLLPVCSIITFFIGIAIPSASGCGAAVGSTLIPVMLRSGIKPAAAAAAVLVGTTGGMLAPGASHNAFVSKMAEMDIMTFIGTHAPYTIMIGLFGAIGVMLMAFIFGDHKGDKNAQVDQSKIKVDDDFKPNPILALMPIVPIALLLTGNLWVPALKMGVAQAMVIGAIATMIVARCNPQTVTKEFFNGTGKAYANIIGIIIAAGVFAAGLKQAGLIDAFITTLRESNEIARWGGSFGPFIMGIVTGSGDAATLAFNETVTKHAPDFGMTIEGLGGLAFLAGSAGRTASPIAGVTILLAGIAMVNPFEVAKRSFPPMFLAILACALLMV